MALGRLIRHFNTVLGNIKKTIKIKIKNHIIPEKVLFPRSILAKTSKITFRDNA